MGNSTLGGVTLQGDSYAFIASNGCRKEALITPMPLYLLNSDQTDVFDYGGTIRTFSIEGIYIGASKAACKTFIDSCEALIQGHQDIDSGYPITFTDDYRGTPKVKVMDFSSDNVAGEPFIIRWSFKIIQSSTNA